jgi:hypothetical protein
MAGTSKSREMARRFLSRKSIAKSDMNATLSWCSFEVNKKTDSHILLISGASSRYVASTRFLGHFKGGKV